MSRTIQYRPEIDGLRTLAVLAVILFHLNNTWLVGGFLGVNVFFVISGYLITSIIYRQMLEGTFSLVGFWTRRIRRLFPAMMAMVGTVLLVGAFLLVRPERVQLPLQAIASIFSFENILLWKTTGGYWTAASENIPLLHTWSLSLEEQFYFCFPIFLILLLKIAKGKEAIIIAPLLFMSLGLFICATPHYTSASFYLLPTRMWELWIGSLLAFHHVKASKNQFGKGAGIFQVGGITLILLSYTPFFEEIVPTSLWHIIPCIGTMLILKFGSSPGPVKRLLSLQPVVYVGKISYSLYLWHWPVIVYLKYANPTFSAPLALVLTFGLAVLSYHLIEVNFRNGYKRPLKAIGLLTAAVALSFLPLSIWKSSPLINDLGNIDSQESLTRGWEFEAIDYIRNQCINPTQDSRDTRVDICVMGSSHARVICHSIADYAKSKNLVFKSLVTSGTGITSDRVTALVPDAAELNQSRLHIVTMDRPRILVIAGRWNHELLYEFLYPN